MRFKPRPTQMVAGPPGLPWWAARPPAPWASLLLLFSFPYFVAKLYSDGFTPPAQGSSSSTPPRQVRSRLLVVPVQRGVDGVPGGYLNGSRRVRISPGDPPAGEPKSYGHQNTAGS